MLVSLFAAAPRHCHMGKRARRPSVYPKHQGDKRLVDRVSQLPDEILAHILSLLNIREAGRSSVLSHRWRDLWKFTTSLNFDASDTMWKLRNSRRERPKYVARVNQVLKLHLRPSLDEFRVGFFLDSSNSCDIDKWINFVIPKRVKVLEINMYASSRAHYTPSEECYLCFKSPSNLASIKCLTSLSLKWVNVNGELIEYFLSNCPNLEQLRLICLEQIVNLNVSGPSVQLKHLEIFRCKSLESLEFCAPKLVSFKYFGHSSIRLSIGSLPLLSELDIGASHDHQAKFALVPFSNYLSQIETLKLKLWLPKDYEEIPQIPELTKLKHLTLDVICDSRFPCFTSLVKAAPSLNKFSFKLFSCGYVKTVLSKTLILHPHECLKDVEVVGFVDRKFVTYLLQNAINLEKITIDPYHPYDHSGKYMTSKEKEKKEKARKRAHRLREKLPSGVKLIVL